MSDNKIKRYFRNKLLVLTLAAILIGSMAYVALATEYPSYNTEQDCRGCHGNTADRHHLLDYTNSSYGCMDCHPLVYDSVDQSYSTQVTRDCLVCHSGTNHIDSHHTLPMGSSYGCTYCHPVVYDNVSQSYTVQVTWDCTVCHSTVIKWNGGATATPTETPIPPPTITNLSPVSPVLEIVGSSRSFSIETDQKVNVVWKVGDTQVQYDEGVTKSTYMNTSAPLGVWNITAVATNPYGSVEYTWTWNVVKIDILEPIHKDGSSVFKLDTTIPIKFQLTDYKGNYVTNVTARLNIIKISPTILGSYEPSYTSNSGTVGNIFIYDTNGNKYSYNLGTRNNFSVGTWRLNININDETTYVLDISLK